MTEDFGALARDLTALFTQGAGTPLADHEFDSWARRVFRYQMAANPVFRRYAEGRGRTVDSVAHWTEVPAVPARAFKHLRLVSGDPQRVERIFRTSGTTGKDARGQHHVLSLQLYRASLLPNFAAYVLPDGARLPLVALLPPPAQAPESSLSTMVGVVEEELAAPGGGWFVDPERGLDVTGLDRCLARLRAEGRPVLLVGTAFSFAHWTGAGRHEGPHLHLPEGSRVMETGGFKGRARWVSPAVLYATISSRTGIDPGRMVNEYGMTELLSQFYQPVLVREGGEDTRHHVPPPWVRTQVLDPRTLDPVPKGEPGILCHLDLANAGSVAAVLTEDRGVEVEDGFRVLGRDVGAEPRGCSLALDDLLEGSHG